MKNNKIGVMIFAFLWLSACQAVPLALTPTAMPTVTATATPTAVPTTTPTPSPTPIPTPTVAMGRLLPMPEGGFLFRPPADYGYFLPTRTSGLIRNEADGVILALFGSINANPEQSLTSAEIIDNVFAANEGLQGNFRRGAEYPITVSNVTGVAYEVMGTLDGHEIEGEIFLVWPYPDQLLIGLAIARVDQDENNWVNEGLRMWTAVLADVSFYWR